MLTRIEESFREAMAHNGIPYSGEIIADGKLHRFHVEGDKASTRNGWLILHADGIPAGAFGNWKTSLSSVWCAKSKQQMTTTEKIAYHARILKAREQRDELHKQLQATAAKRANELWNTAKPANSNHPYLIKKGVSPFNIKQLDNLLLVPLVDTHQKLHNLQIIAPDSRKCFLTGGRVKSLFCLLGALPTTGNLYLCEGWATGATIHTLTGNPAVAAMNAGNLNPVAHTLRTILSPTVVIIIAADNDRFKASNTGLIKGREAANAIGGRLTWPHFPCDTCKCTDFNDLYICEITKGDAV